MPTTDDRDDPRLTYGADENPVPQARAYLILSKAERLKGFVRPVRTAYVHTRGCGAVTRMNLAIAETYAREPGFYQATYCILCRMHRPVAEFDWEPSLTEAPVIPPEFLVVGS